MRQLQPRPWSDHSDLVAFYSTHRNRPEHLYPSERRFLPWLAKRTRTVLDIGCAAGGFHNIWQHFQPRIRYIGVDLSQPLLRAASQLHPTEQFILADCASGLPIQDRAIDTVQALGMLNWEENYGRALDEIWRVSNRFVLFDVRLMAAEGDTVGKQRVAFCGPWDQQTTTPYICVAWKRLAEKIIGFSPEMVMGFGYRGQPAETVMGIDQDLCFGVFLLIKRSLDSQYKPTEVCLDLPLQWPSETEALVKQLAPTELSTFVPES